MNSRDEAASVDNGEASRTTTPITAPILPSEDDNVFPPTTSVSAQLLDNSRIMPV